jgi:hypothetical protein
VNVTFVIGLPLPSTGKPVREGTALADGGLQLARWRAVVLRVLEEVGVPQRDHTGRHDVHGKTVQANNRWGLAILHREGVLVLSVVAATVRDEPLDLVRAVWQLRYHVGVLLRLGVPAYAGSLVVHTGYGLLDREAPLLVVRYVALVELAWRAASEVRRVQVAVQHVVPAETGDANVFTELTTVSMMPSPSRSRNNRYSMFTFEPEQASVPVMQRSVGSSHRSCVWIPLSHQYISFQSWLLFGVNQFWLLQSGTV